MANSSEHRIRVKAFLSLPPSEALPSNPSSHNLPEPSRTGVFLFSGEDVGGWLERIEHFFLNHRIPSSKNLVTASFYMAGQPLQFLYGMEYASLLDNWEDFAFQLELRFGKVLRPTIVVNVWEASGLESEQGGTSIIAVEEIDEVVAVESETQAFEEENDDVYLPTDSSSDSVDGNGNSSTLSVELTESIDSIDNFLELKGDSVMVKADDDDSACDKRKEDNIVSLEINHVSSEGICTGKTCWAETMKYWHFLIGLVFGLTWKFTILKEFTDDECVADDWLLNGMFNSFESKSGLLCCVSEGNHRSTFAIEPGDLKEPNFSHDYNASSSEATVLVEVHRCLNWVESTTFHGDRGGIECYIDVVVSPDYPGDTCMNSDVQYASISLSGDCKILYVAKNVAGSSRTIGTHTCSNEENDNTIVTLDSFVGTVLIESNCDCLVIGLDGFAVVAVIFHPLGLRSSLNLAGKNVRVAHKRNTYSTIIGEIVKLEVQCSNVLNHVELINWMAGYFWKFMRSADESSMCFIINLSDPHSVSALLNRGGGQILNLFDELEVSVAGWNPKNVVCKYVIWHKMFSENLKGMVISWKSLLFGLRVQTDVGVLLQHHEVFPDCIEVTTIKNLKPESKREADCPVFALKVSAGMKTQLGKGCRSSVKAES
ncbi:OLC1v1004931C1 [Oldenlandia corymbosa var. corymbosa]|uniref:OLC1v1004931C1 n=1 Tax=Oldenlandia corymbosa var. corymbosa TaxID=529605 RepID=A0AAV1DDI7_OLDCO|nr:OLC1v1004931C1 [Oldenlandia corymbosa var. corymbosa]